MRYEQDPGQPAKGAQGVQGADAGVVMLSEIREQPQSLARLLDTEAVRVWSLAERWRRQRPRYIFLVARGTSDHAALYGKYVLETLTGIPVGFAAPSVTTVYKSRVDYRDGLVIGISQSGKAADVAAVLTAARANGAETLAVTNEPGSPLTDAAAETLLLHAGPEQAVAATKTFTGTLAALLLLAGAIAGDTVMREALCAVPTLLAETLSHEVSLRARIADFSTIEECFTLGRGYNLATAYELALKLRETAGVHA
jgi:glutamine---fructose-6-phosphate transaminase (isomerizing)